jgi:two-component system C4-dicarboxylate transport sensor histidine kinase DctB
MEITPHVLKEDYKNNLNRFALLGKFASILSHEIGSSLCKIKMNLDVYKEEFNDNAELERLYQIFYTEITRLTKLSNEINQYSRQSESILIKINIYNFFESIKENVFKKLMERGIIIKNYTLDKNFISDYTKLQTAFMSLFNYSIDSLKKDDLIEITSRSLEETGKISIVVKYNGVGRVDMDPAFKSFYSHNISGSGLRLLIFKQLIVDLGGSINLLSSDFGVEVKLPCELNG